MEVFRRLFIKTPLFPVEVFVVSKKCVLKSVYMYVLYICTYSISYYYRL